MGFVGGRWDLWEVGITGSRWGLCEVWEVGEIARIEIVEVDVIC